MDSSVASQLYAYNTCSPAGSLAQLLSTIRRAREAFVFAEVELLKLCAVLLEAQGFDGLRSCTTANCIQLLQPGRKSLAQPLSTIHQAQEAIVVHEVEQLKLGVVAAEFQVRNVSSGMWDIVCFRADHLPNAATGAFERFHKTDLELVRNARGPHELQAAVTKGNAAQRATLRGQVM